MKRTDRTGICRTLMLAFLGLALNGGAAGGAPPPESADEVFTNTAAIRHLKIEIPLAGLNTLRGYYYQRNPNGEERVPVPATVREGKAVYTNVAVHLKGALGSFRPVDNKPGLTLRFDKFVPGQCFHGLSKISLNNEVQDPSFIADKLCRELFNQAGVPVPRADYATVELNGRPLGLYLLTEGWDKPFLKRHFADVTGNFYDPPIAVDINRPLRVSSGLHPEDHAALKKVCQAATNGDVARRVGDLRQCLDLDRFLTLLTLDVMLWNWDGYALNRNNYRVFHDASTHRLVFMPHGMDQMFWKPLGPIITGRAGLVARGLLQTEEGRRLYLERFNQVYPRVFNAPALTNRVRELAARIRPALTNDGLFAKFQFERGVNLLCQRIALRAQSIEEQLAGLKTFRKLGLNETVHLADWDPRNVLSRPVLDRAQAPDALHITASKGSAGAWVHVAWLEEGAYTLSGRIKTAGVVPNPRQSLRGAGLRVVSTRKQNDGVHWDWFPFRESGDLARRGEMAIPNAPNPRLSGTRDWTVVTYQFELRQPLADLELLCELYADAGEAWFDLNSLQLTRKTDICP